MLEFLFNANPSDLASGTLLLDWSWPAAIVAAVVVALVAFSLLGFLGLKRSTSGSVAITATRIALFLLIGLALLRPAMQIQTREPVPGETLVLIDNSRSMSLVDTDISRGAAAANVAQQLREQQLKNPDNNQLRFVAFGQSRDEIDDPEALGFKSNRSELLDALGDVASGRYGDRVSSVVLLSDGGNSSDESVARVLASLKASGTAVHTVGFGQETFSNDIEISNVALVSNVLKGDTVNATVTVRQRGRRGESATVRVESEGTLLASQTVEFESSDDVHLELPLTFDDSGYQRLTFSIDAEENELIAQNNVQSKSVDVRDAPINMMHFEGEPRFEVKFLRRALHQDDYIRLRSLIRTAENKYYRVGVLDADELRDGFPQTRDQLFKYDVLVIGNASAELISLDQQELIREFVARRGGGLLLLGSARSFAEGGYADTTLAQIMPVELADGPSTFLAEASVTRTELADSAVVNLDEATLESLPDLTVVNPIYDAKPGARVHLVSTDAPGGDGADKPLIILASHRYGRGRVAVLNARNTWRWQMHADVPVDDQSHESLMRQLTHWLASPVPDRLELSISPNVVAQGDTVRVVARLVDNEFNRMNAAQALASESPGLEIVTPVGDVLTPVFQPDPSDPGALTASFVALDSGHYEAVATVAEDIQITRHLNALPSGQEFFAAERNTDLLKSIAEQTGGTHFQTPDIKALGDDVVAGQATRSVSSVLELWRTPAMFLPIIFLAILEWILRRRRQFS